MNKFAVVLITACAICGFAEPTLAQGVAGGKTQVVAKIGAREVTLSELRLEIARLRLSPASPEAERIALENIIQRVVVAEAARAAQLHRRPEGLLRIKAAEDLALAEYYLGIASQPTEPSSSEIDDFIQQNPSLFSRRRSYEFLVLTLPGEAFDEVSFTPLFDNAPTFEALTAELGRRGVRYSLTPLVQSGLGFPAPIREQLAKYDVSDNIVLKADNQTQILKIVRVEDEAQSSSEWPPLARRLMLEEASVKRADLLISRLKTEKSIAYYRQSAAPSSKDAAGISRGNR